MTVYTIKENPVFRQSAFIGGEFCNSVSNRRFTVENPYDGTILAEVTDCDACDAERSIELAHKALGPWKAMTSAQRSSLLRRWHDLILEYREELAVILTLEQGKPLSEARGEISYGASFVEWFAEEGKRVYGKVIPAAASGKRILVLKQPVGVVVAITPWNFPNAMITRKVAPALAAGCTVVVKPAQKTPLSALALAVLAGMAGIPDGVFNVVPTSRTAIVGEVLTSHHRVRKVSFTGSTRVGKTLLTLSANTVKKVSMELGGNAPFIVFEDADTDKAVQGVIQSKFRNSGQTCVSTNRIFVHEKICDEFLHKLKEAILELRTGNGLEESTHIGPLISAEALDFTENLVQDAVAKGAKILCGGQRRNRLNYTPVLLKDVTPEMSVFREEIFGPVAAVIRFADEEEVIAMANDTIYGLASYFYGKDHARIWRVAEALDFGMVGVNTGMISAAEAPFGGIKQSGSGREGSVYGIDDYMELKYLNWDIS